MAGDARVPALEKRLEELLDNIEEFKRQAYQQSENRNVEIGALRESLSGAISAADRDSATIATLASRLDSAEKALSRPPPDVNWIGISALIFTVVGSAAAIGNWALDNVKQDVGQLSEVSRHYDEMVEGVVVKLAKAEVTLDRNSEHLSHMESEIDNLSVVSGVTQERVRAVENRANSIDQFGPRAGK